MILFHENGKIEIRSNIGKEKWMKPMIIDIFVLLCSYIVICSMYFEVLKLYIELFYKPFKYRFLIYVS